MAWLARERAGLGPQHLNEVQEEIDAEWARLKLDAAGVRIDTLTPEQEDYLRASAIGS